MGSLLFLYVCQILICLTPSVESVGANAHIGPRGDVGIAPYILKRNSSTNGDLLAQGGQIQAEQS